LRRIEQMSGEHDFWCVDDWEAIDAEIGPTASSREGPMSSFDIDVTRDGGWWMVHIPELGGLTQARYPRDVELMAREYIAVSTGTPIDQVAVNWRRCTL
jgi:hypothetical protein